MVIGVFFTYKNVINCLDPLFACQSMGGQPVPCYKFPGQVK